MAYQAISAIETDYMTAKAYRDKTLDFGRRICSNNRFRGYITRSGNQT
jgi:hypothetical protein